MRVLLSSLVGLACFGCATTGHHYSPQTMPAGLQAGRRDNVQTLDLTRLAVATRNSDTISRGDVVEVSISAGLGEQDRVNLPVRVNEQGLANLPEIGPVALAGLEMDAAEARITAACLERQLYSQPNVTVTMKRQRMNRVMVVGAVKKPDVYELPRGRSDLLAALVAAGGLEDNAGTKVEIRNPRREGGSRSTPIASARQPGIDEVGHSRAWYPTESITTDDENGTNVTPITDPDAKMESLNVDLVSAVKTGRGGYLIEDGGVVSIETRDPEPLHVIGQVRKPDRYDFPMAEDLRVTDAVALAGGTSLPLADKVFVIRRIPHSSETAVIEVSMRRAKRSAQANLRLEAGDVVSVEHTPATVTSEIFNIIRFNVASTISP